MTSYQIRGATCCLLLLGLSLPATSRPAATNGARAATGLATRTVLAIAPAVAEPEPEPEPAVWRLTATVTLVEPDGTLPTGLVEFRDDVAVLGTAPLIATEEGVTASLGVGQFAAGTHALTARYLGSATLDGSLSAPVMHVVSGQ